LKLRGIEDAVVACKRILHVSRSPEISLNIVAAPRNSIFPVNSIEIKPPPNNGFSRLFCVLKRPLCENAFAPTAGLNRQSYLLEHSSVRLEMMSILHDCIWFGTIEFPAEMLQAFGLF
jgi:hypothetical protein